jgi:L,D-transpeptidase YbiS
MQEILSYAPAAGRCNLSSYPLPAALKRTCRRLHVQATRFLLIVSIRQQVMMLLEKPLDRELGLILRNHRHKTAHSPFGFRVSGFGFCRISDFPKWIVFRFPGYFLRKRCIISTSRFGAGQERNSYKTPLGLHRVAKKIGAGWPIGSVFQARKMIGHTWRGLSSAAIAHRILWLEGLEPGFNRGGKVDTFDRYIYIHGLGDELTLGRPASRGCIHVSGSDLLPLFDQIPTGTLVWIEN